MTMTMTPGQAARQEQIARKTQELLDEGCPANLVNAYEGCPQLARQQWEALKAAPEDPERVRARVYAQQLEREQAEYLAEHKAKIAAARKREEGPDLAAIGSIEEDATRRLAELRVQQRHLAPESLVDSHAAAKLADVESEIRSCEQAIARIPLAREELERRRADRERRDAELRAEKAQQSRRLMGAA